jgi:hypothetical protein
MLHYSGPIRISSAAAVRACRAFCLTVIILGGVVCHARGHKDDIPPFLMPLEAAPSDVYTAMEQVTQD